jgi:hypothetical protein
MAVAPSLIRRAGWPAAAALAFAFLALLALHGERPEAGLAPFKSAGLLTAFAPEQAREIDITRGGETWFFRREGGSWRAVAAPRAVPVEAAARIETGLRLLRDSGPLRVLAAEEVSPSAATDFALGDGALSISVRAAGAQPFVIRFGAANPLGVARYVRVDGKEGVPLLPGYVAESWEQVIGPAPQ